MVSLESPHDEPDADVFGPLVSIKPESLIRLGTNLRSKLLNKPTSSGRLVARLCGSYNLIHILQLDDLKLVVRVPATGWGEGLTGAAAHALESQVAVMRFVSKETTIPVPAVHDFDTGIGNEIGAPYICMSFLPGRPVSKAWFDESGPTPLEHRRISILESVARAVAQLSSFSFAAIGSPHDVNGALAIGPCYHWKENDDYSVNVTASGPYGTTAAYLQDCSAARDTKSDWGLAESKILDVVVPCLPEGPTGFVLSVPDFDSQNILVDEGGALTGIIDWDLVQTMPRCVGYCRYPSWITRDWDPLMYGWPKRASENSPQELERYREIYNEKMGEALGGGGDWKYTKRSEVREAVWIAALNSTNRLEICPKLVQVAIGDGKKALDILYDIGTDYLSEGEWHELCGKLMKLVTG